MIYKLYLNITVCQHPTYLIKGLTLVPKGCICKDAHSHLLYAHIGINTAGNCMLGYRCSIFKILCKMSDDKVATCTLYIVYITFAERRNVYYVAYYIFMSLYRIYYAIYIIQVMHCTACTVQCIRYIDY